MSDFVPGDIVRLKSGRPRMTIFDFCEEHPDVVLVEWFETRPEATNHMLGHQGLEYQGKPKSAGFYDFELVKV